MKHPIRLIRGGLWSIVVIVAAAAVEWGRHSGWLGADSLVAGSLPSLMWMLLAGSLMAWLVPQTRLSLGWALLLLTSVAVETLSLTSLRPNAVFDWADLAGLCLGAFSLPLIQRAGWLPLARRPQPVWLLFPAMLTQLACYQDCPGCDDDFNNGCNGSGFDEPVFLSWDEVRADIYPEYGNSATLRNSGKIYELDEWLAIIDRYRGVHIFDVSDPQNPLRQVYLPVPGVTDISVKDDVMYLNSWTDMVAVDLATLEAGNYEPGSEIRNIGVFGYKVPSDIHRGEACFNNEERYVDGVDTFRETGPVIGYETDAGAVWIYGERVE